MDSSFRKTAAGAAVFGAALSLLPTSGAAQTLDERQNFSVERFQLAMDNAGILSLESARVPKHLTWTAGLWLGVTDDPLVLEPTNGQAGRGELIGLRVGAGVIASLALFDWVQMGVEIPLVLHQSRPDFVSGVDGDTPTLQGSGLGAIRVAPKFRILRQSSEGLNLAIVPGVRFPAISGSGYVGDDGWRFEPELLISYDFGVLRAGLGGGYRLRTKDSFAGLEVGNELFAQLGLGFDIADAEPSLPLSLDFVASASSLADQAFNTDVPYYAEIAGALRYTGLSGFSPFVAVGAGGGQTAGTPDWRMVVGLRISGQRENVDDDAVTENDLCPSELEDLDGFMDEDGCPDPDDDRDGVPDTVDGAPRDAEDLDGFEDEDGIPDFDNDRDEIPDSRDRCPNRPGPEASMGCPLPDADGDEVTDDLDACPGVPENKGALIVDGCPDLPDG